MSAESYPDTMSTTRLARRVTGVTGLAWGIVLVFLPGLVVLYSLRYGGDALLAVALPLVILAVWAVDKRLRSMQARRREAAAGGSAS